MKGGRNDREKEENRIQWMVEAAWKAGSQFLGRDSFGFVSNKRLVCTAEGGGRRADQSCQFIVLDINGTSPGAKYRGVELN